VTGVRNENCEVVGDCVKRGDIARLACGVVGTVDPNLL
jgi:hypothetical protein